MTYFTVTVFLLFSSNIFVENIAIIAPENAVQSLSHCVKQLLNFNRNNDTLITYFEANDVDLIIKISDTLKTVVNMKNDEKETSNFYKFSMYLIIIKDVKQFSIFLKRFYHSTFWNPRAKFLVVYSGQEDIDIIFKMAWKKYIININILMNNISNFVIYTYFPYKQGHCGTNISKEYLGECEISSVENLYPKKIPRTINGCLTTIAVNPFDPFTLSNNLHTENSNIAGFENVLIGNLLRKINSTVNIIRLDGKEFNNNFPNGSYTGPVSCIYFGKCDLVYGHLWITYAFLLDFDITYPYLFDKNSWFVPAAIPGKQWQSLRLIFKDELWLAVSLVFIFNIFVWWIFGRNIGEITEWRRFSWCTLYSWSSLLMVSFNLPKNVILRLLVIVWVITSSFLASAYQTQLLTILTKPVYEKQIVSLEELVQSDNKIFYFGSVYKPLHPNSSETEKKLVEKGIFITVGQYMNMTTNISNTGFLGHSARMRYNAFRYFTNPDGTPKLYELKKAISFAVLSMYSTKGFPFMERFDVFVSWFWQSGLLNKWITDTDQTYKIMKPNTTVRKLSLNHFMGAFYLLLLGLFSAIMVFVVELFVVKHVLRK